MDERGFHPFQGRPLFGREIVQKAEVVKSYIVSIPFREDLYSDLFTILAMIQS